MTDPADEGFTPMPRPPRRPLRAAWQGTVRAARAVGWLGLWLPGALIALLLAASLVLWWWSATPGSLAQALTWAQAWTEDQPPEAGRLQASGVQGSLSAGGDIAQLRWTQPGLEVDAQAVRLRWSARLLLNLLRGKGVQIDELVIAELRVNDQRPPSPTVPLESLTLPIAITLPWAVDRLVLEGASPLTLSQAKGLYRYGVVDTDTPPSQGLVPGIDAAHQLTLDALQLAQGRYRLQAVVGAQAPMPLKLSAQGELQAAVPGGENLRLLASAQVLGTLAGGSATLDATAQVLPTDSAAGASPTLVATARLRPWAAQPVEQVDATAHQLNLALLWPQAPLTALSGTLQAQPQGGAWQASAHLSNSASGPLDQQRLPFSQLDAELEQRGLRWLLPRLTARIGASELRASGAFQPADGQTPAAWEGELQAPGLDPALLWSSLNAMGLDATVAARSMPATPQGVQIQASILPAARLAGRAAARSNQGLRLKELRLQAQWLPQSGASGVVAVEQVVLDAADLRLESQGRVDIGARGFVGQARLSLPGARGQLDGDIGYAQGRGDLSLNIDNAAQVLAWARRLQTLPVVGPAIARQLQTQPALQNLQASGQASLDLQWQGGLAEIGFPAPVAAAANKAPAALRLQVALDVPRLEASGLTPTTPAAATGTATAAPGSSPPTAWSVRGLRLKVDGSLADLAIALQGQGSFATWRGEIQTQARLKNALPATAAQRQAESRLDIGSLQIQAQDGSRPDRVVDWSVRSEAPLWLGWLNTATGWALQAGPGQLQVLPTFSATGTRTAASKTAARQPLSLAWDSVRWQAQSLQTRGRLRGLPLSWIDALAATGANAAGPMAQAGVAGDIVFDGEWDLFLPAQTGGAEPLRLNAQLQRSSGDLSLRTGAGQGDAGSAAGSTGQVLQAGVREARLNLSAQGRQIKASLRWDSERLGQASADVGTELAAPGKPAPNVSALDHWWPASAPLNGSFKAALPQVGVWSALAPPGWRMRGTLQAEASISGTRGAPKWRGSLQAEQLALRSVLDGFEFANGQLRATLEDERITIERLVLEGPGGSAAGGTLQAQGQAQWRAPSPGAPREPLIDLTVDTRQLRVSSRPDRRLTLSGQVKAQLAGPRLQIRGQLSADSALFILPDELAPTLGDDVVVRGGRSLPQGTATGVPIEPDVQVQLDLGQQFEVRGRGLKTRLSGQLTVRSTPTAPTPRVLGEVRTVSGTYRAYGQQLTIETGVLRFTGPYDNPTLDIAAVRPQIGDASQRVGVQISGSAQAPRVRLFSDPELPDSEKLAWLVLGRPATGAGAEAAVLQQAALALLARNGGQLDGGFAQAFGLDELGVRGEGTNADGSTTAAALTLGKQLSSKLYLSYERSLAGTVGTVSMFYDVSRRLTVRARAGEENAIDLIFTLRYD